MSSRKSLVDRLAGQYFSAVLHVKKVSVISIQFCWRATARRGVVRWEKKTFCTVAPLRIQKYSAAFRQIFSHFRICVFKCSLFSAFSVQKIKIYWIERKVCCYLGIQALIQFLDFIVHIFLFSFCVKDFLYRKESYTCKISNA